MTACVNRRLTLMLEEQTSKALSYGQKALAVARAAKLQGTWFYAVVLKENAVICTGLDFKSSLGGGYQEHTIPFEGFTAAVAQVKQRLPVDTGAREAEFARFDSFIEEHTCWVKELQAELVRCEGPASSHLFCSQLVSPLTNSFCLALREPTLVLSLHDHELAVDVTGCVVLLRNKLEWLKGDGAQKLRHWLLVWVA